jgi:hypothetical protein
MNEISHQIKEIKKKRLNNRKTNQKKLKFLVIS